MPPTGHSADGHATRKSREPRVLKDSRLVTSTDDLLPGSPHKRPVKESVVKESVLTRYEVPASAELQSHALPSKEDNDIHSCKQALASLVEVLANLSLQQEQQEQQIQAFIKNHGLQQSQYEMRMKQMLSDCEEHHGQHETRMQRMLLQHAQQLQEANMNDIVDKMLERHDRNIIAAIEQTLDQHSSKVARHAPQENDHANAVTASSQTVIAAIERSLDHHFSRLELLAQQTRDHAASGAAKVASHTKVAAKEVEAQPKIVETVVACTPIQNEHPVGKKVPKAVEPARSEGQGHNPGQSSESQRSPCKPIVPEPRDALHCSRLDSCSSPPPELIQVKSDATSLSEEAEQAGKRTSELDAELYIADNFDSDLGEVPEDEEYDGTRDKRKQSRGSNKGLVVPY
eukprot:gnl/MRDRNA2_/MRDRNA2_23048_c0_seq1.p1 gnl/MRDRNA2_/MRDRNA2_23048_c0~~gnl/MRDRNA2_/MRDRNA2_23048_c0_seq1.p1  ORF type:complete len:401 (+),score=85.97 gnl/MRDRNA2_/MRDRNA2_23048_c0_seq1:76-1278(+)